MKISAYLLLPLVDPAGLCRLCSPIDAKSRRRLQRDGELTSWLTPPFNDLTVGLLTGVIVSDLTLETCRLIGFTD